MNMSKSTHLILFFSVLISCISCKPKSTQNEVVSIKDSVGNWLPKAIIYEVNLRQHTPAGTLSAFEKELDKLQELGVNVLWFMPIQPIGKIKRKALGDVFVEDIKDSTQRSKYLGSPYSISNFTDVNPDYGTLYEFKALVKMCHQKGFKVILDWVGNHTSWDNPMITEHPEWYTRNAKGDITDPMNEDGSSKGWTDVADLNYNNVALNTFMVNAMKFWVDSCDVDGFRCDAAMDLPTTFWQKARKELEKSKPVFMLAESEEHNMDLFDGTFDAYYAWEVHHMMKLIAKEEKNKFNLDTVLQRKFSRFPKNVYALNFITNHDENSWNGTEFDRMGEAWKAMAVFTFATPGIPLLYTGQEVGLKKRLKFFEKDTVVAATDFTYFDFYKSLVELKKSNAAFDTKASNNSIVFIPTGNNNLVMFNRESGDSKVIVAINMSKEKVKLNPVLPQNCKYLLQEGYDQKKGELEGWGYVIVKR